MFRHMAVTFDAAAEVGGVDLEAVDAADMAGRFVMLGVENALVVAEREAEESLVGAAVELTLPQYLISYDSTVVKGSVTVAMAEAPPSDSRI